MSVSEEIIKVLDALAERLGIAVDWTAANVLPYMEMLCNKLVKYEIATSVVWMVLGAIMAIVGVILIIHIYKSCDGDYYDAEFFMTFLLVVCAAIGIIIVLTQTFDIVKCITFPEKLIFEELKSLLTTSS